MSRQSFLAIFIIIVLVYVLYLDLIANIHENPGSKVAHHDTSKLITFNSKLAQIEKKYLTDRDNGKRSHLKIDISERFRKRQTHLEEMCKQTYGDSRPVMSPSILPNEAVIPCQKYHFLSCVIPKIASSTWKSHILNLYGNNLSSITDPHEMIHKIVADQIYIIDKMHWAEMVTVITVRHPFLRLISAYRDKFEDGGNMTSACGLDKPRFRMMYLPALNMLNLHHRLEDRYVHFTFREFLLLISKQWAAGSLNPHWRPYHHHCRPCHLRYDYILKLETFHADLEYLCSQLNVTSLQVDFKVNMKSDERKKDQIMNLIKQYFGDIENQLWRKIFSIYKFDFDLFNYEIPSLNN